MKNFCALALIAASASASLTKLINFDFDQYFEKADEETPSLKSAYTWEWGVQDTNFGQNKGLDVTLSGDLNAAWNIDFDNTDDVESWFLYMKPEINLGGVQKVRFYSPYIATQFNFAVWPVKTFAVGETYLQWNPPTFSNFCASQGWSWTLLKAWIDWKVELWECDAGLFNYILTGETHECGLETYDFKGHLLEAPQVPLPFLEKAGEFFPNSCEANRPNYEGPYTGSVTEEPAPVEPTTPVTDDAVTEEPTGLNSNWS
jgi:hypothetical protein